MATGSGGGRRGGGRNKPPKDKNVPQKPQDKEKFGDRLRRYAQYGQNYNNQGANMSTTQRLGGTLFNAFEQETLGKMGMLGGALSASLRTKKNAGATEGGSGVDTPTIPFQPIKGDDIVSAINQSTGQIVRGLNSVNTTMGRGFNTLRDGVQAQSQALNSIVGSNEDVSIQLREIYDLLDRMSFNRGGGNGTPAGLAPSGFMGSQPPDASRQNNSGFLGDAIQGAIISAMTGALTKLGPLLAASIIPLMGGAITHFLDQDASKAGNSIVGSWINENIPGAAAVDDFVFRMSGGYVGTDINDPRYSWNKNKDASPTNKPPAVNPNKSRADAILNPSIVPKASQGKGNNPDNPDSFITDSYGHQYDINGKLLNPGPQSSLTNSSKGVQVASLDPSIGMSSGDYLVSREMGTSESKLKAQEATAEETARKNITQSININARDLLYKADKITFDADTLEFKYNEMSVGAATATSMSPAVPGAGADNWNRPGGTEPRDGSGPAGLGPMPTLTSLDGGKARENAEKYLGRKMSDQEYDYLIRATHAEASAGNNADPREQAGIMASILNRARDMGDNGVIKALSAKNQFQSVTGTKFSPGPSKNFTQGPGQDRLQSLEDSSQLLTGFSRDQKNFTAASSAAYGPGTNISYRDNMIQAGGTTLGGSVFNTSPNFSSGSSDATQTPSSVGGSGLQGPDVQSGPSSVGGSGLQGPDVQSGPSSGGGSSLNAFLDPSKRGTDHASGLKSDFASKLQPFLQAAKSAGVDLKIGSGYRSVERQRQLFNAAVQKYGSVAAARKWVAPPGKSNHNGGNAVDLWSGGKAISANSKAGQWAHANAGKYGLYFRMGHEPWHIEPSKGGATSAPDSGGTTTPDASPVASSGMSGGSGMESESNAGGGATMAQGGGMAGGGIGGADPISGMMGALGGGGNPLSGMMGALGGGGSPFGMIGSLMGTVLGALSSSTSMKAMTSRGGPVTANIINNTKSGSDSTGTNFPDPKTPLPAIDSMFARLFDGSSMFG